MKRILFTVVVLFHTNVNFAQLIDNFSDGNFTINPAWSGEVSEFIVNTSGELQLNAPDAGTSELYTPVTLADSCEWGFYVNMDFAPSNTNLLRIYLQADDSVLTSSKAYFLEVGETGNLDAFKFFRQDGAGNNLLLGSFTPGSMANQPAKARVKVMRDKSGQWVFYTDYAGGSNFNKELEISDNTYKGGYQFFGIYCLYTATRKDKYFFDDIAVKTPVPDVVPPNLVSWQIISAKSIDLYFDEPLEKSSAENTGNFSTNNGIGQASSASLDGVNNKLIHVSFSNNFLNFQNYTLTVTGIRDLTGNQISAIDIKFSVSNGETPLAGNILINEIMADPSPVVGLPEVEFVELFNNSSKLLSTKNLSFTDGTSISILPDLNLLPGDYYILCSKKDTTVLKIFGKTIGLDALPSLNNTGDNLVLKDENGVVIDAVNYSESWYQDNTKKLGGWTLERINPLNFCLTSENWTSSISAIGGTPGKQNSVYNPAIDTESPVLSSVNAVDANNVLVVFNEKLDADPAQFTDLFYLSGSFSIENLVAQPDGKSVILTVNPALEEGSFYTLNLQPGFKDCAGNPTLTTQDFIFALPAKPDLHDIVLNEILFNPRTGGYDFIEFYNRSNKVFDLADLTMSNELSSSSSVKFDAHFLILPKTYVAITEDPDNIKLNYNLPDTAVLIKADLPSFNDDKGKPVLSFDNNGTNTLIDSLYYTDKYHYALLDNLEGVSLERIDFNKFQTGPSNWHSAASTAGFATPGYINSQYNSGGKEYSRGKFTLSSQRISPDSDGYEDYILINCSFPDPGYTCSVNIFDVQGRVIKEIANNALTGINNVFEWDGLSDDQSKIPLGIYILLIEYFDLQGNVFEEKLPVVVAGKLE